MKLCIHGIQPSEAKQCANEWTSATGAHVIAVKMGHLQFKASNGWLENYKKCHNFWQFTISGEAADVSEDTVSGGLA